MATATVASLALIALTTLIHYEVLRAIHAILPALTIPKRTKVLVVIFGAFAAHFVEIAIYGAALYMLAGLASGKRAALVLASADRAMWTCSFAPTPPSINAMQCTADRGDRVFSGERSQSQSHAPSYR